MLERLALTLLMEALARLVSTSTTSSSLLSAMRVHLLAVQRVAFFFQHYEGAELVRPDLVKIYSDSQLQRRSKVEGAPEQQARLRRLRRIELVEWAVGAAATVVGGVRAKAGIAEFVAAERPMNQEPQGGPLGPLPWRQFGSPDSWNMPSRASSAAFTATAWWMIGTSPE